jgi:molybdopterin/thiamine biosynthesis adenylyltransferase
MMIAASPPDRVARQMTLPCWTEKHQRQLSERRVLLAGIGGIGGVIAEYLVLGGVGEVILVHEGPLSLPDLNRQTLMCHDGVGKSRVLLASERLRSLVPDCRIGTVDGKVSRSLAPRISSSDLVIDARTNFEERFLLNRMAAESGKSLIFSAMNGMEGMVAHLTPGRGACLQCVFPEGDPDWDPAGFPVLGAISGSIGAMAAVLALRILAGYGAESEGRLTVFEGMDLSTRSFWLSKNAACPACQGL